MAYTQGEAHKATLEYFRGDELAANVWLGKYALRNESGELLEKTPADTHRRLAKEFARIEAKYPNPMSEDEIFALLQDWTIIPQGSPMSAIGNPYQVQSLSNCFVLAPPEDSYGGILKTDQELVQIMKRRGGVGIDVSPIRPRSMRTSNAAGTTDGIGVFMERFSNSTREVAQGGRRGALMISCHCLHPDIETFIAIKQDKTKVTGANVSVRVTREFMFAVEHDQEITLRWPVDVPAQDAKFTKVVKAKQIWDQLIAANWASAEPGILFWNTITENSIPDLFPGYSSITVNPCGEITLSPYDSCRLMLLNLTKFVHNPFKVEDCSFKMEEFEAVVEKAQRLMDDLVDLEIEAIDRIIAKVESDPEPEEVKRTELELWHKVRKSAVYGRRTGLGITGLGDALAMCCMQYGNTYSINTTSLIYQSLAEAANRSSVRMAQERGAFPACDLDILQSAYDADHPSITKLLADDYDLEPDLLKYGRRNIALTTTAPAGSMSILAQTTSGCEPVFMLSYKRRKKINPNDASARVDFVDDVGDKWTEHTVYHHGLKQWMEVTGETDITKSPYWGATSADIDWNASVDLQAAAQEWVEHSISKTCNLPEHVTKEQVSELYMRAYKSGCKGFTIYRDGSRSGVLVADKPKEEKKAQVVETTAPKRPDRLTCDIHRTQIGGEQYVMIVGLLEDKPFEIFCGLSKNLGLPKTKTTGFVEKVKVKDKTQYNLVIPVGDAGELVINDLVSTFDNPVYESFTRTLSLSLRHGVPVQFVVDQLRKDKHSDVTSFSAATARVLSKHYIPDGTKPVGVKKCGDCGSDSLAYESGCVSCKNCGSSKCS